MAATLHFPRPTIKNIFTLLGLIALFIIIIFNHNALKSSWHLVGHLHWYIVAAILIIQLASYWVNAWYYRAILRVFNHNYSLPLRKLVEGAFATNYVNYMVPSAGAAGAGYLSQVLSPEVKRGQSVLSELMRSALNALALFLMTPFGLFLIIVGHRNHGSIIKESLLVIAIVLAMVFSLFWLVHQESKLRSLVNNVSRRIKRRYPRFKGEKAIGRFVDSFYDGYRSMFNKKRQMLLPLAWSMLYVGVELLTIYMTFLAFGKVVNPGVVMLGYLFANVISTVGGLLFTIGGYELGMAGTFIALGVSSSLAISITVIYRALTLVVGLPPGFYYYRKHLP